MASGLFIQPGRERNYDIMGDKNLNQRLYEKLLDVVGTEEDILARQDIFRYMDKVNGFGDKDSMSISSGSLAEGFDLKGSDEDLVRVLKNIDVLPVANEYTQNDRTVIVNMELENKRPGYASLFLSEKQESAVKNDIHAKRSEVMMLKRSFQKSNGKCILASARFRGQFIRPGNKSHGPCVSDGSFDFAIGLNGSVWPEFAKQRITSCKSKRWLPDKLTTKLLSDGCIYVPVGPKHFYSGTLWRISFVKSEKRLVHSMRHVQLLCYGLLKIVFKEGLGKNLSENDTICSYFLKTCLFWLIEETNNNEHVWSKENLYSCYMMCLEKIADWVKTGNCPNYIVPANNMFKGKVNDENRLNVSKVLHQLIESGHEGLSLCESLESYTTTTTRLTAEDREVKLDFLCFRVLHVYPFDETDLLLSAIQAIESEYSDQKGRFAKGIIGDMASSLHQEMAQLMQIPDDEVRGPELRRLKKEHLQKGCKSDRLCGLIFLASYHCTNGEYYTALEILKIVTEKLKPEACLILRRNPFCNEEDLQQYREKFCGFDLEYKLTHAAVKNLVLLENSAIVPAEFKPEVYKFRPLTIISPAVYAHALRFLCFHHLQEEQKAVEVLKHLDLVVETRYLILPLQNRYSTACTFVGACYETYGDYETAKKYYEIALKCEQPCRSTKYRLQRIVKHMEQGH